MDRIVYERTQEGFVTFPLCGNQGVGTVQPVPSECPADIHIELFKSLAAIKITPIQMDGCYFYGGAGGI